MMYTLSSSLTFAEQIEKQGGLGVGFSGLWDDLEDEARQVSMQAAFGVRCLGRQVGHEGVQERLRQVSADGH